MMRPRLPVIETFGDLLVVNVHVCSDVLPEDERATCQVARLGGRIGYVSLELAMKTSLEYLALNFVEVYLSV